MEKTLNIDGKNIRFKATAGTLVRYKAEMGREFLSDFAVLASAINTKTGAVDFTKFNIELAYGIAWAMAKTADANTPDLLTWLDGFDEFDIGIVFGELVPMMNRFMKVDAKNA